MNTVEKHGKETAIMWTDDNELIECDWCGESFNDYELTECKEPMCNKQYCSDCIERHCLQCVSCERTYCLDELIECSECGAFVCERCIEKCEICDAFLCRYCNNEHDCEYIETVKPEYTATPEGFSIGVEIEVPGVHDHWSFANSELIAGWEHDGSLGDIGAIEYQSQPFTYDENAINELTGLIDSVRLDVNGNPNDAGGHIHVQRTPRQNADAWMEALLALNADECNAFNMRHADCERNYYCMPIPSHAGKHCLVNDEHENTIEIRSFGCWWHESSASFAPAVEWLHEMWEWFETPNPVIGRNGIRNHDAAMRAIREHAHETAERILNPKPPLRRRA